MEVFQKETSKKIEKSDIYLFEFNYFKIFMIHL